LAPSSEQANFSSADIVSLIGKCLTPETGEVFLTEHKKLLVCVSSMQRNVQDFPPWCAEISSDYDLLARYLPLTNSGPQTTARILN
jgi:hypothetical protein